MLTSQEALATLFIGRACKTQLDLVLARGAVRHRVQGANGWGEPRERHSGRKPRLSTTDESALSGRHQRRR